MIEVKNIYKSFGDNDVLKDVSVTFKPGKCNLVIGASGSGKTTLIKCMVGLHEVTSGEILYDNRDFTKLDFKERIPVRKEIGMLFQGSALFDSMTVEQNVMFALNMFTQISLAEKKERVDFCLNRVNLSNVNKLFPSELSCGMKKRVGIARAISMNPKYLFCDEPNSGLDPKTSIVIDELIQEITDEFNITTIVNTHDMNSVLGIGDFIIFLHKGEKNWEGTKDDILTSKNELLYNFVFATELLQKAYKLQ